MNTLANAPEIAETITDNPNPAPAPVETPAPAAPVEDAAPETPAVQPSIREQIAARFKEQRAAEQAAVEDPPVEDETPAPVAEAPPQPSHHPLEVERFKVKVRGNEFEMSREDVLKTAGLTEEEATGIPMPALVRAAQINAAAQDYLTEAKTALKGSRTAAPPATATPAEDDADPEPELPRKAKGTPDPVLADVVQKIQFGDPEDAAAALQTAVETLFERKRTDEAEKEHRSTVQKAVQDFQSTNPDIFTDPRQADLLYVASMHEIKADLMALGASKEDVDEAVTNPAQAVEAHALARMRGMKVRDPGQILNSAASYVRSVFKAPSTSSPAPAAATARTEAKRALTPQPRQATVPTANVPQAAQPKSSSSVVMGMRKARGQAV